MRYRGRFGEGRPFRIMAHWTRMVRSPMFPAEITADDLETAKRHAFSISDSDQQSMSAALSKESLSISADNYDESRINDPSARARRDKGP